MNLVIDQGNASSKVAVFEDGRLLESFVIKVLTVDGLKAVIDKYPVKYGILSSVIQENEPVKEYLESALDQFFVLSHEMKLPIRVLYKTPNTLGRDRLAAVVGAHSIKPGHNLLVIDAGTAITYEFLNAEGCYMGGNISPGMKTRFKALNYYTQKLPLLNEDGDTPDLGDSTETAIRSGVVNGVVFEIDGYINSLRSKYSNLFVFLTGGHSFYFERRLKNSIFADINLVLIGLNTILDYNVEK